MADDSNKDFSGTPPEKEEVKDKGFTQEEVDRMISERVNRENAGRQKAIDEAVAKALKDAENKQRIASLQGEEKLKAEYQARIDEIEAQSKAAQEKLASTQRDLAISKAQANLAELGLPVDFAPNMLGASDEDTAKNIAAFNAKINALVTEKVNESLARGAPKTNTNGNVAGDAWKSQMRDAMGLQ